MSTHDEDDARELYELSAQVSNLKATLHMARGHLAHADYCRVLRSGLKSPQCTCTTAELLMAIDEALK